ncbi:unnamed protein product [Caenorhabditis sp. 36 PRJEB53466]|nr:unnamed protein product [Caenorhabditis sp. 36 PRJEB53466]
MSDFKGNSDSNKNDMDCEMLLPKCLQKLEIGLKSTDLRVSFDAPTNQTTYTYSVGWDDELGTEQKYRDFMKRNIQEHNTEMMGASDPVDINEKPAPLETSSAAESSTSSQSTICRQVQKPCSSSKSIPVYSEWKVRSSKTLPKRTDDSLVIRTIQSPNDSKKSNSSVSSSPISSTPSISSRLSPFMFSVFAKPPVIYATDSYSESSGSFSLDGLQKVLVKLVIIDQGRFRGKLRPFSQTEAGGCDRVQAVLSRLLREHPTLSSSPSTSPALYFAFRAEDGAQKLRRIRNDDLRHILVSNLPKIRKNVVLVLDAVDFIGKGKKIPIQID